MRFFGSPERNIPWISARWLVHLFLCGGEFSCLVCVSTPCRVCAAVSCVSCLSGLGVALVRASREVSPASGRLLPGAPVMLEDLRRPGRWWGLGAPEAVGMSVGNRFQRHYRQAVRPIRDRVLRRLPAVGDPVLSAAPAPVGAPVAVLFCVGVWLSVYPRRVLAAVWTGRSLVACGLDRPCRGRLAWGLLVRRLEVLQADPRCVR